MYFYTIFFHLEQRGVIETGKHAFKGLIALIFMEKLRKFLASLFLVSEENEGVNE